MGKKLTQEEFVERAAQVHGGKYDYSKAVYVNASTKVCIICPIHGEFWQIAGDHLNGRGCKACGYSELSKKRGKGRDTFIEESRRMHGGKYDYSNVEYKNNKTPVCIVCPIHGEFWQEPYHHLIGCGCQKCYDERRGNTIRKTQEQFLTESRKVHGWKYDYSKVNYKSNKTKIEIICPEHGSFFQSPDCHLRGDGCPLCRNIRRRKLLYGVAYYDVIESSVSSEEYIMSARSWHSMLRRCYAKASLKRQPTYIGCSVCEEWLLFSNFKRWWDEHQVEGWCLDKDILIKGNREYSPSACCFVPNDINVMMIRKKKKDGLPQGITRTKSGKFQARVRVNEKDTIIGVFPTLKEAFQAYKKAKEAWIKEVADKWKDQLDPKVYKALYEYQVEITD